MLTAPQRFGPGQSSLPSLTKVPRFVQVVESESFSSRFGKLTKIWLRHFSAWGVASPDDLHSDPEAAKDAIGLECSDGSSKRVRRTWRRQREERFMWE